MFKMDMDISFNKSYTLDYNLVNLDFTMAH